MYQLIGFAAFIISLIVSSTLKRKFYIFSKTRLFSGLSGKEVAEKMLEDNFIHDVKVVSVTGILTDHYNPLTKTVNLSNDVYNGVNIASAAIAAHECGHAVQHARGYAFLEFRSMMVPAVSFASKFLSIVIFVGFLTIRTFPMLLDVGIILFALTTIFTLITLPVEFDASDRALSWLKASRISTEEEYPKAKSALTLAALTYVIAAIGSIAQLMHLISVRDRNRDN